MRQLWLPYGNRATFRATAELSHHLRSASLSQGKSSPHFPTSRVAVDDQRASLTDYSFPNQLAPCVLHSHRVHSPPSSVRLVPLVPPKWSPRPPPLTAIRGVEGGGWVDFPATHPLGTWWDGQTALMGLQAALLDFAEYDFSYASFVTLMHCKGVAAGVFFSVPTCHKPEEFPSEKETAIARLSAQLQYRLAICRFAHYLKAMARDRIGHRWRGKTTSGF